MMEQKEKRDYKTVYTVVERGEGQKDVWVRLGAAFTNRDGSLTVLLDAVPTNGRLHIRDKSSEDHRSSPLGLVRFHGREDVTGTR